MDSYDFSPSPLEYTQASSSSSGSSSSSNPPPPPEKKKRKQNQACDACKSRRVKCDLADLPPDSSCTKCASKGIQCTSILNSTRAPAKRTGPRIEEAKRLYGSADSTVGGTVVQSGGEGAAAAGGGQLFQNQVGLATLTVYGVAPGRTLPQVALSQAVERDLLEVYFRSAHFGVQAIDPTEFRRKYNDAGQLSQYMSEGNQVLCSVMCAWGARYSENPYILPAGSKSLPHSQVGQTREPICEILLERAQTMLDTFGTLRKPSKEAVEALILLAPLVEYKHETRNLRMRAAVDPSHAEETRLLEGIMAEHVEALGLWDDAQVVGFERSERRGEGGELVEVELTGDVIASQMKSQRLLWCSWIWDSFRTAAGRKAPRFSDDAIFEICPHIPRLGNPLPKVSNLSDAQCFLLLVSSYPMMGELLRYAGKHITVPSLKKRNSQPFEELEKSCRVFWRAMDDFAAWFDSVAQRLLGVFPTLSTFSPISWYVSIKLAQTLSYIFVHRTIYERYQAEKIKARQTESSGFFESPSATSSASTPSSSEGDAKPLSPLEKADGLHKESWELTLAASRSSARLVAKILDNDSAGSSSPISPTSANAPQGVFIIDSHVLNKLLVALNECSEWGRIAILSALAKYKANDSEESEHICERVMPQFQHANGAVLLTAVRVVMIHMKNVERDDLIKQLIRKMAPPLVTLVSSAPEIQWVALRNINLLLQKRPDILPNEMRVFFCKYNDPPYVKVEKLDIMVRLAGPKNVDTLLSELKEYASEVDVDFVRKSIKAIGQTAIKIDDAAERCIGVLLDLISTRVSYVVQEAIVVIKDIFRKYPHSYEGIIPTLCASLDELDEPEAKASLIWIIGEYADKIDNADDLLGIFLKTFKEESYQVQLQTLTAIVKLFLKKPDESQAIVQKVLQMATKDCDSPDVRDRAYVYWRLLSTDPAAAKAVVLADRPPISLPQTSVPPPILEELLGEISTLASVYHKPAETFVGRGRIGIDDLQKRATETEDLNITREKAIHTVEQGQKAENLLDFDDDPIPGDSFDAFGVPSSSSTSSVPHSSAPVLPQRNALDDIMSLFADQSMNPPATITPQQQQPSSLGGGGGFGQPLQQQQSRAAAAPPPPAQPSGGGDLLDFL